MIRLRGTQNDTDEKIGVKVRNPERERSQRGSLTLRDELKEAAAFLQTI